MSVLSPIRFSKGRLADLFRGDWSNLSVLDSANTVALDRRVDVVNGSSDQKVSIRRMSDLRPMPFFVLLGEPGIGKSTVLGIEAAQDHVPVLKVRELMTGTKPTPDATLFLDALDEYRIDGQPEPMTHVRS